MKLTKPAAHFDAIGMVHADWQEIAAPQAGLLSVAEPITGKFVAGIALAVGVVRSFVMLKRPGEQVNSILELRWGPPITTTFLVKTPILDYKDGDCSLSIDPVTGELCVGNTCSPNPATGGDAVAVVWRTGIMAGVAPAGGIGPRGPQGVPGPVGPQGPAGVGGGVSQAAFDALKASHDALLVRVNKHLIA